MELELTNDILEAVTEISSSISPEFDYYDFNVKTIVDLTIPDYNSNLLPIAIRIKDNSKDIEVDIYVDKNDYDTLYINTYEDHYEEFNLYNTSLIWRQLYFNLLQKV